MNNLEEVFLLTEMIKTKIPTIHCLTNNISINDCANMILAVGAKPVMAENTAEVEHITSLAGALAVNLGNITDCRLKSILLSGKAAKKLSIPTIIDLVGVGCSKLRLDFAQTFMETCQPEVIKGNLSEIKSFVQLSTDIKGIDVDQEDFDMDLFDVINLAQKASFKFKTIVVVTGAKDVIVDQEKVYVLYNGHRMLAEITGTGCMLNVLIATFISTGKILEGCILATAMLGIASEMAATLSKGTGSFKVNLFDNIYCFDRNTFLNKICVKEVGK